MVKIINYATRAYEKRNVKLFLNILRCVILGPSGSRKTNILWNILANIKKLPRDIYICSRTANQEKYKLLRKCESKNLKIHTLDDVNKLTNPDNVKKGSIMIFDDILTEDQNKIAKFFLTERHREISYLYLNQSYTKIPKKSAIRGHFNSFDFNTARWYRFKTHF